MILQTKVVFKHATDDAPVSGVASRVAVAMVINLTAHNATNIVEFFVYSLVVLKMNQFSDSSLETFCLKIIKAMRVRCLPIKYTTIFL